MSDPVADSAPDEKLVQRGNVETMLRTAARSEKPQAVLAGRAMYWTALLIGAVLTLIPIARAAGQEFETWRLLQASEDEIGRELARRGPPGASAGYLEMLAEFGSDPRTRNDEAAMEAARRAVEADPSRAGAWAQLAWLEYSRGSRVTPPVLEALGRSMTACPVCSQDLVRWRFNFVLANWGAMPEGIRRRAFEQADILRWMGQNSTFLGEMRIKAQQAGIPFDQYRAAVDTPVRSWDIGPSAGAAASLQQPSTSTTDGL